MGEFIKNQIGVHVLMDQSKKGELFGSILHIRVAMNVTAPLCRSVLLTGTEVQVDLPYEKLPINCFLCGIISHMEEQCVEFKGEKNDDDLLKPYGRWF